MSSGCGDVLSLADLQTAKKHQIFEAEVITGKAGGIASGADIDFATNQVTGQTQKTLPAVMRDVGFRPAAFTFVTGGTLAVGDSDVAVLWPMSGGGDGQYYLWKGPYPKIIPAGSTPASTGGVGTSAWMPLGDITLRPELASTAGASLVNSASGDTVQEVINRSISVSFIFDDGWASVESVIKPLFDTYSAKFGVAIPFDSLDNPGRLTTQSLVNFANLGYEVLNHATSGDVMNSNTRGVGAVKAEVGACWAYLNSMGIAPTGFVTPSSVLNVAFKDVVSEFCDYSFTKTASASPIPQGSDVRDLARFNLTDTTQTACLAAVDALKVSQGAIVFYAHDVVNGDSDYTKISAILAKCASEGIAILPPRQCIEKSVSAVGFNTRPYISFGLIDNRIDNFNVTGGDSYTTNANKDITVTVAGAGSRLIQKTVNITSAADVTNLLTFSAGIRDNNSILSNVSVALKLYSGVDGSGTELTSTTELPGIPNNSFLRYYAEATLQSAKSALIFIRYTATAAGTFLVRAPVLRFGTTIEPKKLVDQVINNFTGTIPTQSIAATGVFQLVTLTDSASNGLYNVTSSTITFGRNATVMINMSVVASGSGVATGWLGGACALVVDGNTSCISPVAGGANYLTGCTTVTMKVQKGTALTLRCLATGVAFAIGAANSRYLITEL